jgi:origin recognition complex subunit 1
MEIDEPRIGQDGLGASAPSIPRESSDDEADGVSWEWIYSSSSTRRNEDADEGERKRRKVAGNAIAGAKLGTFECRIGDIVLLKAEGSNDAWVALICEFVDDDGDGDKAANFMWFSTEKEIRNKDKKRNDFYWVWHYTLPSQHTG